MIVASQSYVLFCYVMKQDTVGFKRGCVDFVICSDVIFVCEVCLHQSLLVWLPVHHTHLL